MNYAMYICTTFFDKVLEESKENHKLVKNAMAIGDLDE
jgi:hypothetical protein